MSFIREEMTEGDEESLSESVNLMTGIDFLPTPKTKDKMIHENVIQEELVEDDILYLEISITKAVTSFTKTT